MDISSLKIYEFNSCDCDCDVLKGGDGKYVKLEDIMELLKHADNSSMVPCPRHQFNCIFGTCSLSKRCGEFPCLIVARHQ